MREEPRVDAEDEEAEGEQADGTLDPDLLAACMRNDTDAAKRLIEQGANPCCEDQRQWSPLIWAASHGNEEWKMKEMCLACVLLEEDAT
eukprot:g2912.t1